MADMQQVTSIWRVEVRIGFTDRDFFVLNAELCPFEKQTKNKREEGVNERESYNHYFSLPISPVHAPHGLLLVATKRPKTGHRVCTRCLSCECVSKQNVSVITLAKRKR